MTRKVRDVNAKKVYAAEDTVSQGRTFETIADCQQWAGAIQSIDPLFQGLTWVSIRPAHGNAKSSWHSKPEHSISLVPEHMNEQVILHELAHVVTKGNGPLHGRDFCWNYLDLTLRWRGPSVYLDLRNAFREAGII